MKTCDARAAAAVAASKRAAAFGFASKPRALQAKHTYTHRLTHTHRCLRRAHNLSACSLCWLSGQLSALTHSVDGRVKREKESELSGSNKKLMLDCCQVQVPLENDAHYRRPLRSRRRLGPDVGFCSSCC